jgi:uncharacterized protein YrrD
MMMKASQVIGLKVLSLEDGKQVEDVDDVLFDPSQNRVLGLLVKKGGFLRDAQIILLSDIRSVGQDAVMIDSKSVLQKAGKLPQPISAIAKSDDYLTQTKIVTEQGTELGSITDLYFDLPSGVVTDFEVSQGGLKDVQAGRKLVNINDIVKIGKDATIVRSYTEISLRQQPATGGFQGALQSAGQTAQDVASTAKDKAQEMASDPQNKQNATEMKQKAGNILQKIGDKADEMSQKLNQKVEEVTSDPALHQRVSQTVADAQQKMDDLRQKASNKASQAKDAAEQKVENEVIGKFLTKTILLPNDQVLAKRGEMITHNILNQAKENQVADQVVRYSSTQPIS